MRRTECKSKYIEKKIRILRFVFKLLFRYLDTLPVIYLIENLVIVSNNVCVCVCVYVVPMCYCRLLLISLLLCAYIALYRPPGRTLSTLLTIFLNCSLFIYLRPPYRAILVGSYYGAHTNLPEHMPSSVLSHWSATILFDGSTVRDLSLTSASWLRESAL